MTFQSQQPQEPMQQQAQQQMQQMQQEILRLKQEVAACKKGNQQSGNQETM